MLNAQTLGTHPLGCIPTLLDAATGPGCWSQSPGAAFQVCVAVVAAATGHICWSQIHGAAFQVCVAVLAAATDAGPRLMGLHSRCEWRFWLQPRQQWLDPLPCASKASGTGHSFLGAAPQRQTESAHVQGFSGMQAAGQDIPFLPPHHEIWKYCQSTSRVQATIISQCSMLLLSVPTEILHMSTCV